MCPYMLRCILVMCWCAAPRASPVAVDTDMQRAEAVMAARDRQQAETARLATVWQEEQAQRDAEKQRAKEDAWDRVQSGGSGGHVLGHKVCRFLPS